eukprot:3868-Heterococcus_DN1.PRE.1
MAAIAVSAASRRALLNVASNSTRRCHRPRSISCSKPLHNSSATCISNGAPIASRRCYSSSSCAAQAAEKWEGKHAKPLPEFRKDPEFEQPPMERPQPAPEGFEIGPSEEVMDICDKICALNVIDLLQLMKLYQSRVGITDDMLASRKGGGGGGGGVYLCTTMSDICYKRRAASSGSTHSYILRCVALTVTLVARARLQICAS